MVFSVRRSALAPRFARRLRPVGRDVQRREITHEQVTAPTGDSNQERSLGALVGRYPRAAANAKGRLVEPEETLA